MRILLTGTSGFIGQAVLKRLVRRRTDDTLIALVRSPEYPAPQEVQQWRCPAVEDHASWAALPDMPIDVVIHCAGLAHIKANSSEDYQRSMHQANVELTAHMIQLALQRQAKRFVLLSSVAVHGFGTGTGRAASAMDAPAPCNAYGASKLDAELLLQQHSAGTAISYTIIRPPLVYGQGAPGNFRTLINLLRSGLPLPLASATRNRRSFVGIDNLVDLLITCINHPAAANQTFLVSDGEDLSTADLIRRLGRAMGRPARLFPVPLPLLQAGAALLGKRDMAHSLLGNLQLDITHTRKTLDWTPPVAVDEGLRRAVVGHSHEAPV